MEEILRNLKGKSVDITCGSTAMFRGDVVEVKNGVVEMIDEDGRTAFVAIDKISVVSECSQNHLRPGFVV